MIDRVVQCVPIEIGTAATEANGIFGNPTACFGVIITGAESYEVGSGVGKPSSEAGGLGGRTQKDHGAEFVVVDPTAHRTVARIHNQFDAAEVIGDRAVRDSGIAEVAQRIGVRGVGESGHDVALSIHLCHRVELVAV